MDRSRTEPPTSTIQDPLQCYVTYRTVHELRPLWKSRPVVGCEYPKCRLSLFWLTSCFYFRDLHSVPPGKLFQASRSHLRLRCSETTPHWTENPFTADLANLQHLSLSSCRRVSKHTAGTPPEFSCLQPFSHSLLRDAKWPLLESPSDATLKTSRKHTHEIPGYQLRSLLAILRKHTAGTLRSMLPPETHCRNLLNRLRVLPETPYNGIKKEKLRKFTSGAEKFSVFKLS